ncbi:hypothetical protein PIB30_079643 [Stylosanthes scabra]|uniref:Uncharacterized protein n=1 Tax=Stylosanthes scabra TaxID=79078 RepID=A0ABU6YRI0_9FABA|nr:hypothetical protein [Stylosanthes scabra]
MLNAPLLSLLSNCIFLITAKALSVLKWERRKPLPIVVLTHNPRSSPRIPTTNIFINPQPKHPSSSHSEPMARTKTTTRRPAPEHAHHPTTRPTSSRGKRPLIEEEDEEEKFLFLSHSLPPRSNRGNDYQYLLRPVRETYDLNPCAYKDVFASFPLEEFDDERFATFQHYIFHNMIVVKCPLCQSFLVDLDALSNNGLDFTHIFAFQGWLPLFDIKTCVYPNLVREFYASMC